MDHEDIKSANSTDANVTQNLIEVLVDGQKGFADAADKLAGDGAATAAQTFRQFSHRRASMADELRSMARAYGDVVDSDGSSLAAVHRGWISLKDAITGTDSGAVINAATTGEDHAVQTFENALDEEISLDLRMKVADQLTEIRSARDVVAAMA